MRWVRENAAFATGPPFPTPAAVKKAYDNGPGGCSVSARPSRRLADHCPKSGCS